MPREVVIGNGGDFAVKVGWSADQDVQVGVETDDGRSIAWTLWQAHAIDLGRMVSDPHWIGEVTSNAQDSKAADRLIGEAILNKLDVLAGTTYMGVWANMDRGSCNRLIRLLRKARDAAFGADA